MRQNVFQRASSNLEHIQSPVSPRPEAADLAAAACIVRIRCASPRAGL